MPLPTIYDDPELQVSRKWYEKLILWFMNIEHAAEERVWLMQEARRIKMRMDLVEERQRKRKEREEAKIKKEEKENTDYRTVATWMLPFATGSGDSTVQKTAVINLCRTRNKKYRNVKVGSCFINFNKRICEAPDDIFQFMKSQEHYIKYVKPWHDWLIDTEDLRELLEKDGVRSIVVAPSEKKKRELTEDDLKKLIAKSITFYHTTRLDGVKPEDHIMSKLKKYDSDLLDKFLQ